jgi:hypothetical protein
MKTMICLFETMMPMMAMLKTKSAMPVISMSMITLTSMIALMTDVMMSMMVLDDFDARGCLDTVTCDVYGDLDDGNVREGL